MLETEEKFYNPSLNMCASDNMYSFLKETTFLWDLVIGRKSSSFYKVDKFNITNYEGIFIRSF